MTFNAYKDKKHGQMESDGFVLNYTQEGEGTPAIVIGSHIYYPRTFSDQLRERLQLIFLDQRAFAKRENPFATPEDAYALSKILDDIETLRVRLNLNKIMIIGHSIHAFMALEYAKKFPNSVSHVILIAASPIAGNKLYEAADRYFNESVCPQRKALLAENLKTFERDTAADPNRAFITRMLKFGPMIWYDYTYDAHQLWEGVNLDPAGAAYVWGRMFENYKINQDLDTLICPVFIGLGRYDYWNPPHLWEDVRAKIPDLTLRVFEKSSHTPHLEEAELFDQELISWIRKHQEP